MKRIAFVLALASIAGTGCASLSKGGARGPIIHRTDEPAPSTPAGLDARPELGQR